MEKALIELLKAENGSLGNAVCHHARSITDLRLENGFFFILVDRGNATLTDLYQSYDLTSDSLAILSPSLSARLHAGTQHFRATLLYIAPAYFDSLPTATLSTASFHRSWLPSGYPSSSWKRKKAVTCNRPCSSSPAACPTSASTATA